MPRGPASAGLTVIIGSIRVQLMGCLHFCTLRTLKPYLSGLQKMRCNVSSLRAMIMPGVFAVVSDLIFSTKISGTARAVGVNATIVPTANALDAALDAGDVALVIVDMSLLGDQASAALRCSASHASRPTTVAFYSHVQSKLRDEAKQAGADFIMARSEFSEQLPQLLRQHCTAAD